MDKKQRDRQYLTSLATGEVEYELVAVKRSPRRGGRFFMQMQDALEPLAAEKLPGRTLSVLLFLLARLDWQNWVHVNQSQIAERLKMHQPDVSRAMRQLEKRGILTRGPRGGKVITYRLDPHFAWKGEAKGHSKALHEAEKRWGTTP